MDGQHQIVCPLCRKAEPEFQRINGKINHAATLAEKASQARHLIQNVDALLKEHETLDSASRQTCCALLNIRKKAADMILKLAEVKR